MKLGFLVCCSLLLGCTSESTKVYPQRTSIIESVYASIMVQPDSLYQVHSSVQGILDAQFVQEGDEVSKGDAIAQIKNTASTLQKSNDKLSFTLSQQQYLGNISILKTLKNDIKRAALQHNNDSINFYRQKRLWERNIGTKVTYENKKLIYELSKTALESLQKRYGLTKIELETQMKQAQNKYMSSIATAQDFIIASEISGKVYALYKKPGELINSLEPIAMIGSDQIYVIEMLVDEKDIVKIKNGQSVRLVLDAYPEELFIATVSKIHPKKDERTQTFLVEALFNDQPSVLYPGLTGEGNIIIAQKKEALIIPKSYLIGNNQVLTEKGIIELETGLENMESMEVISGINEQTPLIKKSDD
ncbi:HlyD family efflux transporter periplasmic adaptor subunit [Nonlabens sp.]|uniref:efflux RND transporter periplasmic adaptor subunit n=1 Tax=Nonlabens sp. TaxID=1888209 RepID=UPI001BCBC524|nr:HlyD family efflux transporter periplasmic adaptor subunit [Nonlabens sp.]